MANNPEYLVFAAGGIALAGGFSEQSRWPDNGTRIIASSLVLGIFAAATKNTPFGPLVKAFAALLLLAAVYAYVPAFHKNATKHPRKGKPGKPSRKKGLRNG